MKGIPVLIVVADTKSIVLATLQNPEMMDSAAGELRTSQFGERS
jgi:hypothetical protein